jgi:hypothetical protein
LHHLLPLQRYAQQVLPSQLHLAASPQCSAGTAAAAVLLCWLLVLVLGMCLVGAAAGSC